MTNKRQLNHSSQNKNGLADEIVVALCRVLPPERPVPLHEPVLGAVEWDYLKETLESGWISSGGPMVDRFEAMLAERCQAKRAIAVVNGTAAIQVALQLSGVVPGDEVLVPSLTFVATANAIKHCGAEPHFVEADSSTLGINTAALRRHLELSCEQRDGRLLNSKTGKRIRAILPVHVFGSPVDMEPLMQLADEFGLAVVEDATESLGSFYRGRSCGAIARIGVLSFNGNKIITTGGGGAILTNDPELADQAKHITTTAKLPHQWEYVHDAVGFNYRLPSINAALGCAQLESLDHFLDQKHQLFQKYLKSFENVAGCALFTPPAYAKSNHWLIALILDEANPVLRDDILSVTNQQGILTRPFWRPLHQLAPYKDSPAMDLSVTNELAERVICLPSSANLIPRDAP